MWNYEKRLQYPVNISQPNPKVAQFIMSQYGGPDGEMGASMRYLSQRYAMPYDVGKAVLTDIGREAPEVAHSKASAFFRPACSKSAGGRFVVDASKAPFTPFSTA